MPKIKEITSYLESIAPLRFQEDYDNSGLLTGSSEQEVTGVMVSLDCTEPVIEEAIKASCNLVVTHHPIIFRGIKSLTGKNYVERTLIKAIKSDIAIYAIHTNLDNVAEGVNKRIAEKLGLMNTTILQPKPGTLNKLVTFVPIENTREVLKAIYAAGAGEIGNYSECSFRVEGTGTFTPSEMANPHLGEHNKAEEVTENRVEVIFPAAIRDRVLASLKEAHPYEEVAYYLSALENLNQEVGSGIIGILPERMNPEHFLKHLRNSLELDVIRYTSFDNLVQKVAVCGGAGSFLLPNALNSGADVFVSADFKYHEFFDAENKIMICDVGHYESERFTKELIAELLRKKFSTFAVNLSEVKTNPINYFK